MSSALFRGLAQGATLGLGALSSTRNMYMWGAATGALVIIACIVLIWHASSGMTTGAWFTVSVLISFAAYCVYNVYQNSPYALLQKAQNLAIDTAASAMTEALAPESSPYVVQEHFVPTHQQPSPSPQHEPVSYPAPQAPHYNVAGGDATGGAINFSAIGAQVKAAADRAKARFIPPLQNAVKEVREAVADVEEITKTFTKAMDEAEATGNISALQSPEVTQARAHVKTVLTEIEEVTLPIQMIASIAGVDLQIRPQAAA